VVVLVDLALLWVILVDQEVVVVIQDPLTLQDQEILHQ
jgi:hypothetical protein